VVELASNTAEALAADDAPTITFPLTVALVKVPVIFVAATSVTFALVIAPSAIEAVATAPVAILEVVIAPSVMDVAFPTEVTGPVKSAFVVTVVAVAALPVILPTIGFVTVKFANVPTLVKLEPVTVEFNVVPVKLPASAVEVIDISPLPSKATPLIFLAVANLVAVPALPEIVV
jgi:hypothetical protein